MSDRERPGADDDEEGPSEKEKKKEKQKEEKCSGLSLLFGEKSSNNRKCDNKMAHRQHLFRLSRGKKILDPERKRKRKHKGIPVKSCCFWRGCFSAPTTVESAAGSESPTSDPNSPEFTYDMLRNLIEKNDFYSKECNSHLDDYP